MEKPDQLGQHIAVFVHRNGEVSLSNIVEYLPVGQEIERHDVRDRVTRRYDIFDHETRGNHTFVTVSDDITETHWYRTHTFGTLTDETLYADVDADLEERIEAIEEQLNDTRWAMNHIHDIQMELLDRLE